MKKLFITGMVVALAFSAAAQAELQISGNVTTMGAYQHDDKDALNTTRGGFGGPGAGGTGGITQGDLNFTPFPNADHFGFIVDQAEIDVENEFGENIMARIDVDFVDFGTPSATAVLLEQAYVTANLSIGNGMEFLIGKFDVPIGLESVDRHVNVFSTYTPGYQFLIPTQVLGAKLYYEFNEHWSFDLAAVNSINNIDFGNSAIVSGILRVGVNWGEEGRQSYFHVAGAIGPEQDVATTGASHNQHLDYLADGWGNFAVGDYWDIGWEATYRQTNSYTGGANQKALAGQLYFVYQPSDVWTVQARGAAFWEINPANARGGSGASTTGSTWSGFEGTTWSGTLGATYQITDGAQVKFEYRFDFARVAGLADSHFHTGVAEFAYSF